MIGMVQGMLGALSTREGMGEKNIVTSSAINIKKARQKRRGKREHKREVCISEERQDTEFIYTREMGRSGLNLQWIEYIE